MNTATQPVPEEDVPDFVAIRAELLQIFLEEHLWGGCEIVLLPGTTTVRKTFRLTKKEQTAILLDCTHPKLPSENLEKLIVYSKILNDFGLSTPKIIAVDEEQGFVLLEDFGDKTLAGEDNLEAYLAKALHGLIQLQKNLAPEAVPGLSDAKTYFQMQNATFIDWYWSARYGYEIPPDVSAEYYAVWNKTLNELPPVDPVVCLAIYDADHLVALNAKIGILNPRNLLLASPLYDVVSLLETADEQAAANLLAVYKDATQIKNEVFDWHHAVLTAQRLAWQIGELAAYAVQNKQPQASEILNAKAKKLDLVLQSHPSLTMLGKWFARSCPDFDHPVETLRTFL